MEPAEERIFDVLIIGGGPAGLTAAVYAARKNLQTAIVTDELGPADADLQHRELHGLSVHHRRRADVPLQGADSRSIMSR